MSTRPSTRPNEIGEPDPKKQLSLAGVVIMISEAQVVINGDYYTDVVPLGSGPGEIYFRSLKGSGMPIYSDFIDGQINRVTGQVYVSFSLKNKWIEHWSLECRRTQPLF